MIGSAFKRALAGVVLFAAQGGFAAASNPQEPGALTIFSDRHPELVEFLVAAFSVQSGVKTTILSGRREDLDIWQSKDPSLRVDVVLSGDVGWLEQLSRRGRTRRVESVAVLSRVPTRLRDPEGHWFGVSQRARAFHLAKDRAAPETIATYEALADPAWRGRLCSRPFDDVYTVQLVAAALAHHGEIWTRRWLSAVRANLAVAAEGNDRAQIEKAAGGRCDLAIGYTNYRGLLQEAQNRRAAVERTTLVLPRFEKGATHVALSAAALHADALNDDEARRFLDFLLSDRAQRIMMSLSYEHPISPDTPLHGLVAEWGPIEPDTISAAEIARLSPEARRLVREIAASAEAVAAD